MTLRHHARALRVLRLALPALASLLPFAEADAQIGGLIKKKVSQAAAQAAPTQPVTFDEIVLELTPDRIAKVIAGRTAAMRLALSAAGPDAIRKKLEGPDQRQVDLYQKIVDQINGWDEKRGDAERCADSVLSEARDRRNQNSDAQFMQKYMQLGMDMARAQQRGDSAEMRRITQELERMREPTAADSALATRTCPVPAPSPQVRQWMALKQEVDSLQQEVARAETAVEAAEQAASGMTRRQVAIACERMHIYAAQKKDKKPQNGLTPEEVIALDEASRQNVLKDLAKVCL